MSTSLAFISLLLLLIAPLFLLKITNDYLKGSKTVSHQKENRFYNFFSQYKRRRMPLLYSNIFFLRRYSIILVLTLLPLNELMQIHAHMISTIYVVSYLCEFHPYEKSAINYQEITNEVIVLMATYPLFFFTDWFGN